MKKFLTCISLGLSLSGCTSDAEKAKSFGFESIEQMKYLQGKGYKFYEDFRKDHSLEILSTSRKFAEAQLDEIIFENGKKIDTIGLTSHPIYREIIDLQIFDAVVKSIEVSCNNDSPTKKRLSIDGINCETSSIEFFEKIVGAKTYCFANNPRSQKIFNKNNAFFIFDNSRNTIFRFGLIAHNLDKDFEAFGKFGVHGDCDKFYEQEQKSIDGGFSSIDQYREASSRGFDNINAWKIFQETEMLRYKYNRSNGKLEKATVLFYSDENDFREFKDNGGLSVFSNWRGYLVSSIEVGFGSKTVELIKLTLHSNLSNSDKKATFNNIKNDLTDECGGNWNSFETFNQYHAETNTTRCRITSRDSASYDVFIISKK